jgi:hypothetical protein
MISWTKKKNRTSGVNNFFVMCKGWVWQPKKSFQYFDHGVGMDTNKSSLSRRSSIISRWTIKKGILTLVYGGIAREQRRRSQDIKLFKVLEFSINDVQMTSRLFYLYEESLNFNAVWNFHPIW